MTIAPSIKSFSLVCFWVPLQRISSSKNHNRTKLVLLITSVCLPTLVWRCLDILYHFVNREQPYQYDPIWPYTSCWCSVSLSEIVFWLQLLQGNCCCFIWTELGLWELNRWLGGSMVVHRPFLSERNRKEVGYHNYPSGRVDHMIPSLTTSFWDVAWATAVTGYPWEPENLWFPANRTVFRHLPTPSRGMASTPASYHASRSCCSGWRAPSKLLDYKVSSQVALKALPTVTTLVATKGYKRQEDPRSVKKCGCHIVSNTLPCLRATPTALLVLLLPIIMHVND